MERNSWVARRMEELLREAVAFQAYEFAHDDDVNGADLVDWFASWREDVKRILQD